MVKTWVLINDASVCETRVHYRIKRGVVFLKAAELNSGGVGEAKKRGLSRIPPKQWVKIVVYSLLLVNFVHYAINDFTRMTYTWNETWTWFDWTSAFATTLDESAWFLLLMLLELETYVLSDEAFTARRVRIMHGLRALCIVVIGHTIFAFGDYLLKLDGEHTHHTNTPLCSLAGQGASFTRNLQYWDLEADTCEALSKGTEYFQFDQGELVTDLDGWQIEWGLAWSDFIEVVVWVLILGMIEIMVRLQDNGITKGTTMRVAKTLNATLYLVLWAISGYWAALGHYVFAWDEALWILGFMVIGMNLSDWRDEIDAQYESEVTPTAGAP